MSLQQCKTILSVKVSAPDQLANHNPGITQSTIKLPKRRRPKMKKRIHILTAEEHRKLMVDPDNDWLKDCGDPKYRNRYFVALGPTAVQKDERAPADTKYSWPVLDTTGMRIYGKPAAYFIDEQSAKEWVDRENAICPPPPKPGLPQPPYPIGTYYVIETADQRWEIRKVSKPVSKQHTMPYQQNHYAWAEKTISVHQTKQEVKQELIKLVTKK
jgi:hypothetical protein